MFSSDPRILARGGAHARKARHLGGSGARPPRKILDFRRSEIVSGAIWK